MCYSAVPKITKNRNHIYIDFWSPLLLTRSLSHARQPQSRVNLTAFIMPTSGKNRKYLSIHSRSQRPHSFGQHQESRPLGRSNNGSPRFMDFLSLCACSESSLINLIGSCLNLLYLQLHSKPECRWTWPEVADQKERILWGREFRKKAWKHLWKLALPKFLLLSKKSEFPKSFFLEGGGGLPLPAHMPTMILSYNITVATKNPHLEDAFLFCFHCKYLTYLLH